MFWDIILKFGRRGQEVLHDLQSTSYKKYTDDKGHAYYKMTYNESNKTHHGVDSRENGQEQRMYAKPGDVNCPVSSLDLYLIKLNPKCTAFFQQPLAYPTPDCWYAAQPMGRNKLASMMSRISTQANLSQRYTNHCIKATVATILQRSGLDLLSIMTVTGHRNVKSLDSYINAPTDHERRQLSAAIQKGTESNKENDVVVTSNNTVTTPTPALSISSSGSLYITVDKQLNLSKDQMSNSTMNIPNNAPITDGSLTFNIIHKEDNTENRVRVIVNNMTLTFVYFQVFIYKMTLFCHYIKYILYITLSIDLVVSQLFILSISHNFAKILLHGLSKIHKIPLPKNSSLQQTPCYNFTISRS